MGEEHRRRAKLDPHAREFLQNRGSGGTEPMVQVLVRTRAPLTDSQAHGLAARHIDVGTVAGDVVTASVTPSSLETLADMDFVIAVELAGPLRPEAAEHQTDEEA